MLIVLSDTLPSALQVSEYEQHRRRWGARILDSAAGHRGGRPIPDQPRKCVAEDGCRYPRSRESRLRRRHVLGRRGRRGAGGHVQEGWGRQHPGSAGRRRCPKVRPRLNGHDGRLNTLPFLWGARPHAPLASLVRMAGNWARDGAALLYRYCERARRSIVRATDRIASSRRRRPLRSTGWHAAAAAGRLSG